MKHIKGYENLYAIDEQGNVYSLRYNRRMKPCVRKRGNENKKYHHVCLCVERNLTTHAIHRLVAETFILNPLNLPCVDHIDHDLSNNSVENLRWCTREQNQQNRMGSKKTSKYKGVSLIKGVGENRKKWAAQIAINRKVFRLGNFYDEIEAAIAYNKSALLHHGEFARVNIFE